MGGGNHCHSLCHLATFNGEMYGVIYTSVIGSQKNHMYSLDIYTGHIQTSEFSDQSQRCIAPRTSNHGMSPHDSASDSG